jgi:hypothetical protein
MFGKLTIALGLLITVSYPMQANAATWGACGIFDDRFKLVRVFYRSASNVPNGPEIGSGTSDLHCGSEKWGYRHIKDRHRSQWEYDAYLVGRDWRTHADWAIDWILKAPQSTTYRAKNDTYCYSRKLYLVRRRDGKVVGTRTPHVVVARMSKNIITAFPNNKQCG